MINLNKKLNNMDKRYYSQGKLGKGRGFRIIVFLIIAILALGIPIKGATEGFKNAQIASKALASAYSSQNFGQIQTQTTNVKKSLQMADASLNFLIWLRIIPIVGGYYGDIKSLTSASVEEISGVEEILIKLKPKEKELGFLGTPIAGQDRISQLLKVLEEALPFIPKVEGKFKKAYESVKDIDTEKYPEEFRGIKVKQLLTTAKNFMVGAYVVTSKHPQALEILPDALGVNQPKNYLLLFQNDKEIRATGGFLTAFAFLKIDKGQISTTTSDDIYRLDERLLATCLSKVCPLTPPAAIIKYLPEVDGKPRKTWSMRDSNISPDVPTSAKEFERMYQLLGSGLPFDGIIFIDSQVVEELIEVTGPIDVFGT